MKKIIALLLCIAAVLTFVPSCKKPRAADLVIILPGIMGSEMFLAEDFTSEGKTYKSGTRLWVSKDTLSDITSITSMIRLLSASSGAAVKASEPIINDRDSQSCYGSLDTYRALYKALYNEYYSDVCDVVFYGYDWREDPINTAAKLDRFFEDGGYKNVVIVAHSMGGLVSSQYFALGKTAVDRVMKYVSLGTPYLGAQQAVYTMYTGNIDNFFTNLVVSGSVVDVCTSFPSMYSLLPFKMKWKPTIRDGDLLSKSPLASYDEECSFMAKYIKGFGVELRKASDANDANMFLEDGRHITQLVDSYYIVGNGEQTITNVDFTTKSLLTKDICTAAKTNEGDGTVSYYSATAGGILPSDRIYVKRSAKNRLASHISLADGSDPSMIEFIIEVINGTQTSYTSFELRSNYNIEVLKTNNK